jgi:predicted Fe-Mo cluster-binding NifX family protein
MRVSLPVHGDRISPVLDVARRFVVLDVNVEGEVTRRNVRIENTDPVTRARRIVELGADVLICGAISWPLEVMLASAGMRVIPNTCGPVEEVIAAFIEGKLSEQAFLMPGCTGQRRCQRRRHRHGKKGWNT